MKILPTLAFCSAALRWVLGNLCGDKKKSPRVKHLAHIFTILRMLIFYVNYIILFYSKLNFIQKQHGDYIKAGRYKYYIKF